MAMIIPAVLLSGCTPALLAPDDREQVGEVRVDETFGSPVFHPNGKQEYWITVDWKVTTATGSRVLAETTTRCSQKSSRGVDEWFAVPEQARVEVERVLGKVGQRMAEELLSPMRLPECAL